MDSEAKSTAKSGKGRLARRFNWMLLALYLVSILLTVPAVYLVTQQEVHARANEDLTLLVDMLESIQGYVGTDLRPHFVKEGIFYSPAISGIVAISRIAAELKKRQPQFYIKMAGDNVLNPKNRANPLELDLLRRFRSDRKLSSWKQEGTIHGRPYLVTAAPKVNDRKGCMRCHGNPAAAPADVTETYGTGEGYHYEPNTVVGLSVVGVPLADVEAATLERSQSVIIGLTGLFGLLFIAVNLMVRRLILRPIMDITQTAEAISKGEVDQKIVIERNDEIGDLGQAFELMRRSIVTAMKHMRRKS